LLEAAFLIARAPPEGAADAMLAYDGTTTLIKAAAINFVMVLDMANTSVLIGVCRLYLLGSFGFCRTPS
jgi:hypothetical protein